MAPGRRQALTAAALAGAAVIGSSGCRKPAPAEVVLSAGALGAPAANPARPPEVEVPAVPPPMAPDEVAPPSQGGAGGAGSEEPPRAVPGCEGIDVSPRPFSRRELLASAADCALAHYCEFAATVEPLVENTAAYAADPTNASSRASARAAYEAALTSWQLAEAFRFGPAARSSEPSGRDLRDAIYAWPLRSECKVDEQIVSRAYATAAFTSLDFRASPLTGRSLSALEYLLFYSGSSNACSAFSEINASGSWSALGETERQARRAEYAAAVARDLQARSSDLLAAFQGPSGFREQLVAAGSGDSPFATEQAALNAVSDALFYLDLEVKDLKLARPLGLTPDCAASLCPSDVETPHARLSTRSLRQNLIGFERLFAGCGERAAGLGFDDWLHDVGASDLADRMLENIAEARRVVEALPRPIEELLATEPETVSAVHAAVKGVTDLLKAEFVTVLNLELPAATEGDND